MRKLPVALFLVLIELYVTLQYESYGMQSKSFGVTRLRVTVMVNAMSIDETKPQTRRTRRKAERAPAKAASAKPAIAKAPEWELRHTVVQRSQKGARSSIEKSNTESSNQNGYSVVPVCGLWWVLLTCRHQGRRHKCERQAC